MRTNKKKSNPDSLGDAILLRGAIEYALRDAGSGELVQGGSANNIVVSVGRVWMLNRLMSNNASVIDRVGLGTGTSVVGVSNTELANSFSTKTGTMSSAQYTSYPPSYELQVSWASNETHASSSAINEFGLYASGTLVGRLSTSAGINFGSTNTLAISYRLSN